MMKEAIEAAHCCSATFQGEWFLREESNVLAVALFELHGHPRAKRCYAWTCDDDGRPRTTIILGLPPVDSPEDAVRAARGSSCK